MNENPFPLLSVVTVCYNAVENLRVTYQSVRQQTYPYIEYIIIDGASTDGTLHFLEEQREKIDYLVSEPDNGIYDAMNKGIKLAKGDYICFLNAGDTFSSPDIISQLFGQLGGRRPGVIYGETYLVDKERNQIGYRHHRIPEQLTWRSFLDGMLVCHQSFYARLDLVPLYDLHYRFSSDFDWGISILKRSEENFNTHLCLTHYLNEGVTTENRVASLRERFCIMQKHYGLAATILAHMRLAWRLFERLFL